MAEFLAALVLTCCLVPPACHAPATADQLLAASERQGQEQRPLNWPASSRQEDDRG